MKYVEDVAKQIKVVQEKYTYKNVFNDWLKMVLLWTGGKSEFIENGDRFIDIVEEYFESDLEILSRCSWSVFNTSAKKVNFLLAVNDALNTADHDKMHDFIIENFS